MKLNTEAIKDMSQRNEINSSFFEYVLSTKWLPHTLYKDCSVGFPWGEWDRTARLIEDLAYKSDFLKNFKFDHNRHFVLNFLYFFPKESKKYLPNLWNDLSKLPINDIKTILATEDIGPSIIEHILNNFELFKTEGLDEVKIIYFLLAAQRYSIFLNDYNESDLAKYLLKENIIQNSYLKNILEQKVKAQKKDEPFNNENKKLRCALMISGQFREPIISIDAIVKKISENSQIDIKEIFIASWKNFATYNTSEPNKFMKHLSSSLVDKIKEGIISIDDIMLPFKGKITTLSKQEIYKDNASQIPIRIALNDESMYPYNGMSNPEKMYFNNALWIETLEQEYFERNFDIIIKVRPDVEIINFHIQNNIHNTILAEEGWIFRRWGFGMGDQIFVGGTKPMLKLLTCHKQKDICTLVKNLMDQKTDYWGHVNLGVLAWKENISVDRIKDSKFFLKRIPLIDESFLQKHFGFKDI